MTENYYHKICSNLRADEKCILQPDLTGVPTTDLIRELAGRESVVIHDINKNDFCGIFWDRKPGHGRVYGFRPTPQYDGPVTILVIPGDLNE